MQLKDLSLLKTQCLINGVWCGEPQLIVTNPANGHEVAQVPRFGAAETEQAIEAANAALPAWRAKSGKERSQILRRWLS